MHCPRFACASSGGSMSTHDYVTVDICVADVQCRSWAGKPGWRGIQRVPNSWRLQPIGCECRLRRCVRYAASGPRVCSTRGSQSLADECASGHGIAAVTGFRSQGLRSRQGRRHPSSRPCAGAAGLAGAFTACLVAVVLAFATRLIQHMPHNAQGAIVLSGVAGILQFGEAAFLWRVRLSE